MNLSELKEKVYRANMFLHEQGLAPFTWGNASGIDRDAGVIVIKPSGVPYDELSADDMVVLDLDGNTVEGDLRPSSDTPTHCELYKAFPRIGGVVHTHSEYATAFAQAGMPITAFGTTHADFSYGDIPCAPKLTEDEVKNEYELNTGRVIARKFRDEGIDPNAVPGVLVRSHGVFTWGGGPEKAAENAAVLEICARMAFRTLLLAPDTLPVDGYLLDKHYLRKHGKNAYYGQKKQ